MTLELNCVLHNSLLILGNVEHEVDIIMIAKFVLLFRCFSGILLLVKIIFSAVDRFYRRN